MSSSTSPLETDVAIIGAGPIGLELALELKRRGIEYLQFERGQVGQTIFAFHPQMRFYSPNDRLSLAGIPLQTSDNDRCTREQYLAYMRSLVIQNQLQIRSYEEIVHVERLFDGSFLLESRRSGKIHYTRAQKLVLASGCMHRPHTLEIPGEHLPHVRHAFSDAHEFFQQRVLLVGGRSSAIEAALQCCRAGAKVTLSYRRPLLKRGAIRPWVLPEFESRVRNKEIRVLLRTSPIEIHQDYVKLLHAEELKELCVRADFVLLMTGYEADRSIIEKLGLDCTGPASSPYFNPETMESSIPGIYLAGTICGGQQKSFHLFIDNCHQHCTKIASNLEKTYTTN